MVYCACMAPMHRTVNKQFFKKWSPGMAYVSGFFAADGYMWISGRGSHFFGFQINDRELLEEIRDALGSNHKIATRTRPNPKWNDSYRLQIGSKEMFTDLLELGMTPAKSNSLSFPAVPEKYLSHFIRGYFDGDGNVYFKRHYAKDRGKMRWIFQSRFTSGSVKFLEALHICLKSCGLKGGYIYKKNRGYELVLSRHYSVALYGLMYNNGATKLYLPRKKRIFEKAIGTLYGGVAQIG